MDSDYMIRIRSLSKLSMEKENIERRAASCGLSAYAQLKLSADLQYDFITAEMEIEEAITNEKTDEVPKILKKKLDEWSNIDESYVKSFYNLDFCGSREINCQ